MEEVVVMGCGLHPFGHWPEKSVEEMGGVAIRHSLDDANLEFRDIQVAYTGRVFSGMGAGLDVVNGLGWTGIPVINIEMACASSSAALIQAHHVISAGVYDIALVVGFEKMARGLMKIGSEQSHDTLMGFSSMPVKYAMKARRYMEDYGATGEMFAHVSVKSHRNGALNPYAQYRKAMSLEEVLGSRMVADPIHLFECSPTTDGASAVIIARRSVARKFKPDAELVQIAGWAQRSDAYRPKGGREEDRSEAGMLETAARQAYERAGIGPEDVDVTQVHDAFSPAEVFSIEGLGLVGKGEGAQAVWQGRTEITGDIPVNTDGGLLSRGHPVGASGGAMITEIVRQLTGRADARQVPGDPRVGLVQNSGIGGVNVVVLQS